MCCFHYIYHCHDAIVTLYSDICLQIYSSRALRIASTTSISVSLFFLLQIHFQYFSKCYIRYKISCKFDLNKIFIFMSMTYFVTKEDSEINDTNQPGSVLFKEIIFCIFCVFGLKILSFSFMIRLQ